MSGHSKWSTIKHKKATLDAKKGKEFSKISRLISIESKGVGGDVHSPSLKTLIEKAKALNMPKDTILRAVAKGAGNENTSDEKIIYEMYGPGGVAILLESSTDNKNRTNQELKHLISTLGYQMAEIGSAQWAFKKNGNEFIAETKIPLSEEEKEKLEELKDALFEHDDINDIYTNAL
jgi:YebC/PmpR family DNA-binding regulatory protein